MTENSIGKGLQDKYIFNANSITKKIYTNKCNLKKVFFLKRSREKDFFVERISNLQRKKMYVIINLIGSNKIIETNNDYILHHNDTINLIAEKVDMFNLYLPDKKYYKNIESFIEGDLI